MGIPQEQPIWTETEGGRAAYCQHNVDSQVHCCFCHSGFLSPMTAHDSECPFNMGDEDHHQRNNEHTPVNQYIGAPGGRLKAVAWEQGYHARNEVVSELLEACKATDEYFNACASAWAEGDRIMPEGEDVVRVSGDSLDMLADTAAEKVKRIIAKAPQ